MKMYKKILVGFGLCVLASCNTQEEYKQLDTLFTELSPEETGVDFRNELTFDEDFNIFTYRNFYNGGGVALGDINNDDLIDIYLTSNQGENKLYLNKGNLRFEDITAQANVGGKRAWSTGVSMADVNGDGFLDIYVCNSGDIKGDNKQNELFINNGDLTFSEKAEEYGLADRGFSTHAAFFDYDKDGDLDVYLLNNSYQAIGSFNLMTNKRPERDSVGGDKLFRNDGNQFIDVSEEANIYGSVIGFGLGVTVGDVNMDGWQDIFVSNDFFEKDYLYINNGDGTFKESLEDQMNSISAASMGADMADINNDNYPDIFVTDMLPEPLERLKQVTTFENWDKINYNVNNGYYWQFNRNMLHLNNGNGSFSEVGRLSGVQATDWSWGALFFDMNLDGNKDIFVANGIYQDITDLDYLNFINDADTKEKIITKEGVDYKALIDPIPLSEVPNYAFKNNGNLQFENVSEEWGLGKKVNSNGSAFGDLDNDGDLDLVVSNINETVSIFKNQSIEKAGNHFLKLKLVGANKNTNALGAKVYVTTKDAEQYYEQMPIRGFQSSVDNRINVGVGLNEVIQKVQVIWPDGKISNLNNIPADQTIVLNQSEAIEEGVEDQIAEDSQNPVFMGESQKTLDYTHQENPFVDFDRDRLIYHMKSTEGPKIAKGDANGDGRTDLFIGGAKGYSGQLFLQTENGEFILSEQKAFKEDSNSEDTDAVFFDADGDGDNDLFVASGGNEFAYNTPDLADRLYINDGSGTFSKAAIDLFKKNKISTGAVAVADIDGDLDLDIFVGGRLIPFTYGVSPDSYIYLNTGQGDFSQLEKEKAKDLQELGLITSAEWADIDADGDVDLVCAGEYMPITILENSNGSFTISKKYQTLLNKQGWWNTIWTGDIDNDGDIDIIGGNHGLNSKFKAYKDHPLTLYVNDFDNNGSAEQVLTVRKEGKDYPFTLKQDLVMQMPGLKKQFLKFKNYNDKSIEEIFSSEVLDRSVKKEVNFMETALFINNGDDFEYVALPWSAQLAPMYAINVFDFDNDGKQEILLGGNFFNAKPEAGRYDASYGTLLKQDNQGKWRSVPFEKSGIFEKGQIRSLVRIEELRKVIVGKNNEAVSVLQY